MVQLRSLNKNTPRELLKAIKPKFLVLELRAGERKFRWAFPLWALKESVIFGLKALRFSGQVVPEKTLAKYGMDRYMKREKLDWLNALQTLLLEEPNLLSLPSGEAFVSVETNDFSFALRQI
mgnify:CR=1 FL=1